jgi:DNA-binding transcriptional ArsR family regulator
MASGEPEAAQPLKVLSTSKLRGEAQLVHRRLTIVDLIDSHKARGVEELAAALDVSHRTVHSDLTVLRHAVTNVRYCRDCREYAVMGLNRYLCEHLSLPMAEALWAFFQPSEDARDVGASPALQQASRKLACGIRLILARRGEESAIHFPG